MLIKNLNHPIRLLLCVLSACLFMSSGISASEPVKTLAAPNLSINTEKPVLRNTVIFGVYPVALYEFDTKQNTFKIEFYAWWRTKDKNYEPEKSVEIINAEKYSSKFGKRAQNGDEYFTFVHYYATIRQYWNPRNFPFDHEALQVGLEDFSDMHYVVFEPDYEQSAIHSELSIPNWKILNFELSKSISLYNTNFGDISAPKGLHSRLTFQIDIKHDGWEAYFNYFIAFFVTAFLSALVIFLEKERLEVKLLVILSAVFAFIGNKYVLDSILTDVAAYSLANLIQLATFFILFFSIIFMFCLEKVPKDLVKRRQRIARLVGYLVSLIYIICVGIATYCAVIS